MYQKQRPPARHQPTPPKSAKARVVRVQVKRSRDPQSSYDLPIFPPPFSSHLIALLQRKTMLASPFHYQSQQTPATSYFHHQTREFLPKIPSPLSPRSANINGSASASSSNRTQQPDFMSSENYDASIPQKPESSFTFNAPAPQHLPFSKRAIKRAPAVSQDALTERRRGMFLKKVREGREDRRFERHGEDVSILLLSLIRNGWRVCKDEWIY
jgi:hypothetical protein